MIKKILLMMTILVLSNIALADAPPGTTNWAEPDLLSMKLYLKQNYCGVDEDPCLLYDFEFKAKASDIGDVSQLDHISARAKIRSNNYNEILLDEIVQIHGDIPGELPTSSIVGTLEGEFIYHDNPSFSCVLSNNGECYEYEATYCFRISASDIAAAIFSVTNGTEFDVDSDYIYLPSTTVPQGMFHEWVYDITTEEVNGFDCYTYEYRPFKIYHSSNVFTFSFSNNSFTIYSDFNYTLNVSSDFHTSPFNIRAKAVYYSEPGIDPDKEVFTGMGYTSTSGLAPHDAYESFNFGGWFRYFEVGILSDQSVCHSNDPQTGECIEKYVKLCAYVTERYTEEPWKNNATEKNSQYYPGIAIDDESYPFPDWLISANVVTEVDPNTNQDVNCIEIIYDANE